MSIPTNLGRLEKIDLRQAWTHEAHSFTPWLALEENLKLLSETVQMDLVLEAQEQSVGPFRADLLCRIEGNPDHWVLIENQIERTDHTHLGQLITYAAGLHAVTIVWIAGRFTDEHRAALDWLNEVTGENISFFGLEIELWRIGESNMAPKFNVVSKPNEWTKLGTVAKDQVMSSTGEIYLNYWSDFREFILQRSTTLRPMKPQPQLWYNFSIGSSEYNLQASASVQDRKLYAGLRVYDDPTGVVFAHLLAHRSEIDAQFPDLIWDKKEGRKKVHWYVMRHDVDITDQVDRETQFTWLLEHLELARKAVAPYVAEALAL